MENKTFSEQLSVFKKLGFEFNPGVTEEDLLGMWGEEAFEKDPFSLLYISLGSTIEREPWTPITNQAWHFDTEAIEDTGAYVAILQNLQRISRGEIIFSNISDVVDHESQKASITFEFNGEKHHYDLAYDNDWVDPLLFTKIVGLTQNKAGGRFTYFSTGGQGLVVGYGVPEEVEQIKKETGLNITWLD